MRRVIFLVALILLTAAVPLRAQIGKSVLIQAGTPEDKALGAINAESDPAQKLALIDKFLADFGQGDMAVVAYEQYINFYLGQKNYDKAGEYAEKLLAVDPSNFNAAVNLLRAAAEKHDTEKIFVAGEKISAILAQYKASPAPEGMDASGWAGQKQQNLEREQENVRYTEYQLFNAGYQARDPMTKAALLERFVAAFPESSYAANANEMIPLSYQAAQNYPKMTASAEKILAKDPKHPALYVLLADYYSEQGTQLDKAEADAKQAIEQLGSAKKPEGVADADWQKQASLQTGGAWSALGQVYIIQKKDAQALDAFQKAAPLLKPAATAYARNQYRMGFALINLKRYPEARAAFTEAASVDSPYRAPAEDKLKTIPTTAPAKRPAKKSS
jgi:tetratricopeptide (TPR) repeat protein